MKVRITDLPIDPDLSCDVLTIDQFNDLAFHPYLQSMNWDAVIIDLNDKLLRSYVSQVFKRKFTVIPIISEYPINKKQLMLLIEIMPENTADIMKAFKEQRLEELMKGYAELYKWNHFI